MAGKKITELSNKSGVIQNHKTVIADSNGIAYQTDYLGSTTGATLSGTTAIFTRNDGNTYNLDLSQFIDDTNTFTTGATLSGTTAIFTRNDGNTYNLDLLPTFCLDVTYSELITLLNNNQLIQSSYYLINDFKTVTYIQFTGPGIGDEEINTGTTEPMIVQAISSSGLSTNIISTIYPTDKITWKPLFNDRDYDAVLGQSTGVITSRYDTINKLYRDYDWRNIIFRRWETISGSTNYDNYQNPNVPFSATTFAYQDFTPFNLNRSFDSSVGSGLEIGQIGFGAPYQLDNVVFQSDCALSKVTYGIVCTFQDTFNVNNIDILINQLCQYEFNNNNIKYVQSNQFNGDVQYNSLMDLQNNLTNGLRDNIGDVFMDNTVNGDFEKNRFHFFEGNDVTGDIFQNLFVVDILNKTFTGTTGMQANSPSVTLLDAVNGDVEQILSGGTLTYVIF